MKNQKDIERGKPENVFDVFGYFEEFIIDGKMIGTISKSGEKFEDTGREVGYYGTKHFVAESDILLDNGKKIKQGQDFYTRVYPLCGKRK